MHVHAEQKRGCEDVQSSNMAKSGARQCAPRLFTASLGVQRQLTNQTPGQCLEYLTFAEQRWKDLGDLVWTLLR